MNAQHKVKSRRNRIISPEKAMKNIFQILLFLLLFIFGLFLIIRSYQHVILMPGLIGLTLVLGLSFMAVFRATVIRKIQGPKGSALLAFFKFLFGNIRPMNLWFSLPFILFGLIFFLLFYGLQHGASSAMNLGLFLRYWYINELLALLLSPFIIWSFVRDESTPAWQRAVSAPIILLFFGGVVFLVKILQWAWAFVAFKCIHLYFQRPDSKEHLIGCLQSVLNIIIWVVLGILLLNRHDYTYGALENLPLPVRALGASMLFGCVYYCVLGISEIFYRPLLFAIYYFDPKKQTMQN